MGEYDRRRDERGPPAPDQHPQGAGLILNKVSGAPGFWIGNLIVMAGVPSIMKLAQAKREVEEMLERVRRAQSKSPERRPLTAKTGIRVPRERQ
jgi:molybdopterin-biosynthesis enzyme MoeA-like protein